MSYNIEASVHVFKNGGERVTSAFGPRTIYINGAYNTNNHSGIDLINRTLGSDYIVAFARGMVTGTRNTVAGFSESLASGNYVKLKHDNGYTTEYFHMKQGSVVVKTGQIVEAGQALGYMGATGWVNGAHLHFGIRLNGTAQNPEPYLLGEKSLPGYTGTTTTTTTSGEGIMLTDVPLYVSSTATAASNRVTGVYYLWGPEVIRGRCRITNLPQRIGVVGQVTGWVESSDLATAGADMPVTTLPTETTESANTTETDGTADAAELEKLRTAVETVKAAVANL